MGKNILRYVLIFTCLFCVLLIPVVVYVLFDMSFQLRVYAKYAGVMQASHDYENGKRRLCEIKVSDVFKFSGNHEGPFEIWIHPIHSRIDLIGICSAQNYVIAYNSKMKNLYNEQSKMSVLRKNSSEPNGIDSNKN